MKKKLLFLTLNVFSATGGIEKVCRVAGKALYQIGEEEGGETAVFSMYDEPGDADPKYFPLSIFKGFGGNRIKLVIQAIQKGRKADVVILSHLNLLLIGILIKLASPKTKLIVVAHGIEVWEKLPVLKQKMLKAVDLFLPVSRFTGKKLEMVQGIAADKIQVLNNCLDPFLEKKSEPEKERGLKAKYGFCEDDFILLTLTRLKFSEQYKGYDKVVEALATLQETHPRIKYLVVGRYDSEEKARLDTIIRENKMEEKVVFAGFVPDKDLAAHFNISDIYIMPSTGEGFGIVFIEALFHGLPVIAGNVDGSVDALANGKLGTLINPYNPEEIIEAIMKASINKKQSVQSGDLISIFGFKTYAKNLQKFLFPKETHPKTG